MITVITPSFNRSKLLSKAFDSLRQQTTQNFEWIIVDDGSEDNTREQVEGMSASATFPLYYIYKQNGGKHTAVNIGVTKAQGELVLILDSDDELPPHAIQDIEEAYAAVKDDKLCAGVCGYMAHRNGKVIGRPMIDTDTNTIDLRYKLGVCGDMAEVYRTDLLRKYPFPEIPGEKFCPELLCWNRIAQKYKLHVFSKVIYYRDYLDGGLTDSIIRIRMKSPVLSMMTYQEMTSYSVPFKIKVRSAINYWRFWCCRTNSRYPRLNFKWVWTFPVGIALHWMDLIKTH